MKAYGQSQPSSASKTRCQATFTRDFRHTWQGCAHTATRPKTILPPVAGLGAIKRKAICFLGFSVFPQSPAWERAVNWACLRLGTLNCWTNRQHSRDPHMVMEVGSHNTVSVHKCENMLIAIVICGYSCLQLERRNQQVKQQ